MLLPPESDTSGVSKQHSKVVCKHEFSVSTFNLPQQEGDHFIELSQQIRFAVNKFSTHEQPSENTSTEFWVAIYSRLMVQTWLYVGQTLFMTGRRGDGNVHLCVENLSHAQRPASKADVRSVQKAHTLIQ